MKPGIQTFFAEAGETACYALCLVDVADEWGRTKFGPRAAELDPCAMLQLGVAKGRIHYNEQDPNDEQNFYVDEPAKFLEDLTGVPWKVEKAAPDAAVPPGSYTIERWERAVTGAILGHFARMKAKRPFNSLSKSLCVERGRLVSYRVCTPLA